MPIRTDDDGVVVARGDIELSTAPPLRHALYRRCLDQGSVVVDMAEVTFMDSTGLRELLRASATCKVTLRNVPPSVQRLLRMAGVETLFTIV